MKKGNKVINVAIVGGGPGCKAVMDMIFAERLNELRMKLIGVAGTNPNAVGYRYAQEKGVYTTLNYRDLYQLKDLNMIIELTGRDEVINEIFQDKPDHIRVMGHVAARLFWDVFRIEERRLVERERAEAALRESEEKYFTLVESSLTGIYIDQDGKIVFANKRFSEIYGYSRDELIGMESWKLVHPEDRALTAERRAKRLRGEEVPSEYEARGLTKNGETIWVARRNSQIEFMGRPAILGNVVELTERKRAEDALRLSEQEKEAILNSMSEYVVYHDTEHRMVWANGVARKVRGLAPEEVVGRRCYEVWHQLSKPCPGCPVVKTYETGQPQKAEMTSPDGRVWFVRGYPLLDENGGITGVVEITMEITERKQAERALRESEERYHMLLEASPDPVVAYDMEGTCTYINAAFTRVFGWMPAELLGKELDYVPDENWPERQMIIKKVLAGESFTGVESRRYNKDGNIIDVSISAATHLNRDGIPVGSVHTLRDIRGRKRTEEALQKARDELEQRVKERTAELMIANNQLRRQIDERKRAEKELKASEEKYRLLFNYDPNPLFLVDVESAKILDVNEPACGAYQFDRKELLGMSFQDLFDPEDAGRLQEELHRFPKKDEYVSIDKLWGKKKDGDLFVINFHARVVRFRESESQAFGLFYIIRTVDITRRLECEAQLMQASKMANLGEMATGIAHELNQPLNVMRVGGDFLAKMITRGKEISDDQLMKVSRNITEQVERAANLINHLREFGRKSDFKVYPVDLNEPIREVFTMMGQHLKLRNIEVDLKLDEKLPKIMSDKNRLEQIFLNLVTNARDAMKEKGPDKANKLTVATYQEGDRVVAEVSDTGTGMPKRIQNKIFDPFFTTKEVGKGTGLGMSICHGIIESHKGKIEVESKEGEGTTVRVMLPTGD